MKKILYSFFLCACIITTLGQGKLEFAALLKPIPPMPEEFPGGKVSFFLEENRLIGEGFFYTYSDSEFARIIDLQGNVILNTTDYVVSCGEGVPVCHVLVNWPEVTLNETQIGGLMRDEWSVLIETDGVIGGQLRMVPEPSSFVMGALALLLLPFRKVMTHKT